MRISTSFECRARKRERKTNKINCVEFCVSILDISLYFFNFVATAFTMKTPKILCRHRIIYNPFLQAFAFSLHLSLSQPSSSLEIILNYCSANLLAQNKRAIKKEEMNIKTADQTVSLVKVAAQQPNESFI